MNQIIDSFFRVNVLASTPNPQTVIYLAMKQCHADSFISDLTKIPSEEGCGDLIVKHLLPPSHFGVFEHPQITFNVGFFPHSVLQQARTHRVGISFDVQSFRWVYKLFIEVAEGNRSIESTVYLRPPGRYINQHSKLDYTEQMYQRDLQEAVECCKRYQQRIEEGQSPEQARALLPFEYRQHFVVSFNVRSLMHFLDLRSKKDAQLEIQQLCELILPHFQEWCPQVADWYIQNRLGKARLAP